MISSSRKQDMRVYKQNEKYASALKTMTGVGTIGKFTVDCKDRKVDKEE